MLRFATLFAALYLSLTTLTAHAATVDITSQLPLTKLTGKKSASFNLTFQEQYNPTEELLFTITFNPTNQSQTKKAISFSLLNTAVDNSPAIQNGSFSFDDGASSVAFSLNTAAIEAINLYGQLALTISLNGGNWTFGSAQDATPPAVPVPAAAWLLGSGLATLLVARRRKTA